jgi:hypothetical protein
MTSTFVALAIQYMFTMLIRCKYCTYTSLYIDDEWGRGYLFRAWRMCLLCLSETDRQTAKEEKANPLKSYIVFWNRKSLQQQLNALRLPLCIYSLAQSITFQNPPSFTFALILPNDCASKQPVRSSVLLLAINSIFLHKNFFPT